MARLYMILLLLTAIPTAAVAEKRAALVIGNSTYQHTPRLPNPKNDATDVAAALTKLGFKVIAGFDLDKAAFDGKVREFADALKSGDTGAFFYAGHGLQVAGQNYLVPVDARLTTAAALEFEMVRLEVVQRVMERTASTNVLFLDACRDNPLARNLANAMGTRSGEIGRGLAAVEGGIGTLISFSTQPGNVALDGVGRNSPFAGSFVKHVLSSKEDLSGILIAVRNDVMRATSDRQVPWEHSALRARFYFDPTTQGLKTPSAPVPDQRRLSEAAEAWDRTKDTSDTSVLEAFIARYKDTFYADLARSRIAELRRSQTAVVAPAVPPTPASNPGVRPISIQAGDATFDEANRQINVGNVGRAVAEFENALSIFERLPNKTDPTVKRKIAGTHERIGALSTGDKQRTCTHLLEARKLYIELGDNTMAKQTEFAVQFSGCAR